MISPRGRLVLLATLIVLPALTIPGLAPSLLLPALILIIAAVLLAISDAVLFAPKFSNVRLAAPESVRLSKNREGKFSIRFIFEGSGAAEFLAGFPFPEEIGAAETRCVFKFDQPGQQTHEVTCKPAQRGRFLLQNCFVQTSSRLGFWNFRRAFPLQTEFRVYPDLLSERRNFAALFLRRGAFGIRQYRQVGKGREFEKLREYIPGDGADEVHWKATAKRGHLVTKVFQIERTQEVYVLVDCSRLSARFAGGTPALERFINSALILSLAAARQNDLFGLVTFSDRVHSFIRAKNGKAHYNVCRDALYTLQSERVTPDFEDLFTFLRLRLRRRALLIFLSALDDPALAENFSRHVSLLTRQHIVIAEMVRPPEAAPLFSGAIEQPDEIYRKLGGHLLWRELEHLQKQLQRNRVEFALLPAEQFASETVSRYLRVKQRQLL